jgi:dipeptidyl aminopeptidase/acylaminoacyl peptidase
MISSKRSGTSFGLLLVVMLGACSDSGAALIGPEALDLEALFQPATAAEISGVEAEWATRSPRALGVAQETSGTVLIAGGFGTARVFSHLVDGYRHYGATLAPTGAAVRSLPVVVFTHGGDAGVNVNDVALLLLLLGDQARNFVFVIPSFRSEKLTFGASTFTSQGTASPWDRDVDDALSLLQVALENVPEANPERIGVLGISRGGGVALLMAIRDRRIDLVSDISGPTDFFAPWVRGLTEDALRGQLAPLPGIQVMNERFIKPLAEGSVTAADFRRELVRRSPVLWAARLPATQVHHGTADDVVPVTQGEALMAALQRPERAGGLDEFYLYPGAGHNLLGAPGVDSRTLAFLQRLRYLVDRLTLVG